MEKIDNSEFIERCLISRNCAHLSQAQGTLFIIHPLKQLLGKVSLTPFDNSLLLGNADRVTILLTFLQKLYLSGLRKSSTNLSSPLYHHISLADMTQGFKKWKESTTTSPSTRHLGHYKSFLASDGIDNNTAHCSFNNQMLQTFNTILNATIESGTPSTRWLSSIVVMIEKIPNTPRINKLRIINIYEAD